MHKQGVCCRRVSVCHDHFVKQLNQSLKFFLHLTKPKPKPSF